MSRGMILQKILEMETLRLAKNVFPAYGRLITLAMLICTDVLTLEMSIFNAWYQE